MRRQADGGLRPRHRRVEHGAAELARVHAGRLGLATAMPAKMASAPSAWIGPSALAEDQPAEAGGRHRLQEDHQRREGGRQMPEREGEQALAAGMADQRQREQRRHGRSTSPATCRLSMTTASTRSTAAVTRLDRNSVRPEP